MKWIVSVWVLMLGSVSFAQGGGLRPEGQAPLNVILMIGDGMGLSQVSTTYYYGDGEPAFNSFRYIGLQRTSPAFDAVTMSSAAATAMSCGIKTYNMAIGVNTDTVPVPNLVEILSGKGYSTGLIATSSITDATPAGFYAHRASRVMHREIGQDLVRSDIDFFAGGGIKYFIDTTGADCFKDNGIVVDYARLKKIRKPEPGDRYGFLLAADRMPAMLEGRKSYLEEASLIGIDFLSAIGSGFFLMIESSQIDWAGHGNQADYLITEMNDFDETIRSVLKFAEKDGKTLVIVTADHETGGFTLSTNVDEYGADFAEIEPRFATNSHSATLIPVFAYGPGAEEFTGIYENTEIFHKLIALLGAD